MNRYKVNLFWGIVVIFMYGCGQSTSNRAQQDSVVTAEKISRVFDLQGHRGARGFRPENTISAFIEGVGRGIRTVELDVVISKDSQVVVSHEPFFNHNICLDSTGKAITEANEKTWNIYHPTPKVFADILFKTLGQLNVLHRTFIQSFDVRTLQAFRKLNPGSKLVLLVENKLSFEENIKKLGFDPAVYSPYYKLVTPELIAQAHAKKIQVIPWTVNDVKEAEKLKKMGIDGIITDYPGKIK